MNKLAIVCFTAMLFFSAAPWADTVDINHDNAAKLALHLKGIGKTKAKAIIAYRKKHGAFKTINELLKVKGIGKKTLAANRKKISLGTTKQTSEPYIIEFPAQD